MMNFDYMMGGAGASIMFWAWIPYVLSVVLLFLGIVALWKYINSK